ncbi:efflux RND transporter permease subunit [Nitratiruptor sp. SB155-2]|uniref:efflux RND transporter permease subunit n=1 Tax=Nitratiruptor sp. (strain SB155-2) TaxID=387092 RepID=UPI0001586E9F|nr:efflux RND transporter permease subunit [Nitratiruptor sp. SB155-2]BAF69193.1 efflux transporter, RND superfamily [Nitratiruptor sp. SB155-2]
MFEYFYQRPYLLFSLIVGFFAMGIIGLKSLPKNLFPDANRPQVVVITSVPGATAEVAANTVSKPIEEEISRISLVRDVSSVNVANFSIVKAEFEYEKGLEAAAVDVANALSIARGKLPKNANPSVYTVGDFTLPVEVVALSPKNSNISLQEIRKIAESHIKPYLLANPHIGNVEVFGGYQSAINIEVDPFKAKKYGVDFDTLAKVLFALNKDIPIGFTKSKESFYTITYYGEKDNIEKLKNLHILPNVKLSDIAKVSWSYKKRTSGYLGNGKNAIALSIQRAPAGSVLDVSDAARAEIKKLQKLYPNIDFQIADTQRTLIETANENMLEALRDAIVYTLLVLLFFLGNFRAIIAAGISIPLVFFGTIAIIWLGGGELNIVIYTAIILALGMLVDDAVVVLENIERHLELNEDMQTAIVNGTKEVLGPVFAGTVGTIAIIFPLMFVGDFPEHIFRPLISTLIIALLVSYFLSITFIPRFSAVLYKNGTGKTKIEQWFEDVYKYTIGQLIGPYISVLKFSNGKWWALRRMLLTAAVVLTFVLSLKNVMPLIGKDVMPPMDTGIIKAQVAFSANETVDSAEKKLHKFLVWLHKQPWVKSSSVAFGSESGVLSLGSGNLPSEATITINAVDRFHRNKTIWQLEDEIRDKIAELPGVKKNDVFDFGATALSTIKAPLDIRIKAADYEKLPDKAKEIIDAIRNVKGLTSISQSWDKDFQEVVINIDKNRALSYGVTPYQIAMQIPLKGQVVSLAADMATMNTQFVRMYLKGKFNENIQSLKLLPIKTKFGEIPLSELAKVSYQLTPAKIERDKLLYSVDVSGYRSKRPVTHITDDANAALAKVDTTGFVVTQEGDIAQLHDSFKRMIKAIAIGVIILIMTLTAIYESVRLAIIMILVLPLSMIGAAWGMLIFHKPSCMPSMVGLLLLFGIIIKNAVLLIDFYKEYEKEGKSPFEAAIESVRVRFRPVMMTAFGTIAGMIPIALEQAVGLERLSPLADVAIGGLLVGTLLTLIYVPMYAYATDPRNRKTNPIEKVEEYIEE